MGTPDEQTLSRIGSPRAQEYVRNLPYMPKKDFAALFRNANPDALHLLDQMLAFDPTRRVSVEEALEHKYLAIWHDVSDEPVCPEKFDFTFEVVDEVPEMRQMILDEVRKFRAHVRNQPNSMVPQTPVSQSALQSQGQGDVPMPPQGYDARAYEDPRPEQAGQAGAGLESELQGGLDVHGYR